MAGTGSWNVSHRIFIDGISLSSIAGPYGGRLFRLSDQLVAATDCLTAN